MTSHRDLLSFLESHRQKIAFGVFVSACVTAISAVVVFKALLPVAQTATAGVLCLVMAVGPARRIPFAAFVVIFTSALLIQPAAPISGHIGIGHRPSEVLALQVMAGTDRNAARSGHASDSPSHDLTSRRSYRRSEEGAESFDYRSRGPVGIGRRLITSDKRVQLAPVATISEVSAINRNPLRSAFGDASLLKMTPSLRLIAEAFGGAS